MNMLVLVDDAYKFLYVLSGKSEESLIANFVVDCFNQLL